MNKCNILNQIEDNVIWINGISNKKCFCCNKSLKIGYRSKWVEIRKNLLSNKKIKKLFFCSKNCLIFYDNYSLDYYQYC